LLQRAAAQAGPLLIAYALDWAVPAFRIGDHGPIIALSVGYGLCAIAGGVLQHLFIAITARIGQDVLLDLRCRIFRHAQTLSLEFHERYTSGRLTSRATTDVEALRELLDGGLDDIVSAAVSTVYITVTLLVLDWPMGLAALAAIAPVALTMLSFRRRTAPLYRLRASAIADVVTRFSETFSGIRVVQAFRRERPNDTAFSTINARHEQISGSTGLEMARYVTLSRLVANIAVAVLVLWGAYRVASGGIELGVFAAVALYLRRLYDNPLKLGGVLDAYQSASASLEKIAALLAQQPTVPEPHNPTLLPSLRLRDGGRDVTFDHVTFGYRASSQILPPFTLTIPAGQTVALVGPTGAGKSTIANLLARFYDPTSGSVLLDGIDLRDLADTDLRKAIAIVTQDPFLFSGTVADNIAISRPEADLHEIHAAALAVGAHEFISELSDGYETDVSKRGGHLSAGQRQLISLARVFIASPSLVILDEATASLDIPSERAIQHAMHTVLQSRTALIIAHRLSTVQIADRVIALADGRVIEDGPPTQLLANQGPFANLHQAWLANNG
jgi:ATP-binding cassette subfamily B protein